MTKEQKFARNFMTEHERNNMDFYTKRATIETFIVGMVLVVVSFLSVILK